MVSELKPRLKNLIQASCSTFHMSFGSSLLSQFCLCKVLVILLFNLCTVSISFEKSSVFC